MPSQPSRSLIEAQRFDLAPLYPLREGEREDPAFRLRHSTCCYAAAMTVGIVPVHFQDIPMKTTFLSIGARARRFMLELPLEQPDGFGGVIRTYAPGPAALGRHRDALGRRAHARRQARAGLTHRVTLRYRDGVTGAMRLTSGLRRFAIRSAADPDGSRRDLVCLVEEMRP